MSLDDDEKNEQIRDAGRRELYVSNEDYVMGTAANESVCINDHRLTVRTAYPPPTIYSNQVSTLRSNKLE